MTKPQFASEPSMEDILASIRKMISEDRVGPRPLPDRMTRTPFSETPDPTARPGQSFGSLSDAIKAAASPSEQRHSLEERIAELLDKGATDEDPLDPLAAFTATRPAPASEPVRVSRPAATHETNPRGAQDPPTRTAGALPFGTRAPASSLGRTAAVTPEVRRDDPPARPVAAPAPTAEPKAEAQRVIAMPSRYPAAPAASPSAPAPNAAALNGQGHRTSVASLGSRVAPNAAQPAKEPVQHTVARAETPAAEPPAPADIVKAAISEHSAVTAAGAPSEALVDAMVELVTKEPGSLSVFTSGMAFIKGVSDKGIGVEKSVAAHKKGESTLPSAAASQADDSVPELDGAAAELLRPMLRQWLAENMPRIVEAALRSELTRGGKGRGKA